MVGFREVYCKYRFDVGADRLGPDMPFSHWRLYFRRVGRELCLRKFKRFGKGAEFRPGAYAVTCSRIEIGDRVTIRPQSMLFADPRPDGSGIIIEDDVLLGSGVHIYTGNHRFDDTSIPISEQGHALLVSHRGARVGMLDWSECDHFARGYYRAERGGWRRERSHQTGGSTGGLRWKSR